MADLLKRPTGRAALLGLLAAAALLLGWIESLIPISVAIPGIKLGLANAAVLLTMYLLGNREAFAVSITKVLLSALLFGGLSALLYSLTGAIISFCAMHLAKKCERLSCVGVSAAGGAAHVLAQLVIAILLSNTIQIWRLAGVLMLAGTLCGALMGVISAILLKRIKRISFHRGED